MTGQLQSISLLQEEEFLLTSFTLLLCSYVLANPHQYVTCT